MKKYTAYHFANYTDTLGYGDGRKIVLGQTLSVTGKPDLCNYGLHGSESILDALGYASGPNLWLTEIWGDVQTSNDKLCGKNRKAVRQYGNVLPLIVEFALWCAAYSAYSPSTPPSTPSLKKSYKIDGGMKNYLNCWENKTK